MAILKNGMESNYTILHNGNALKRGYHNNATELWAAGGTVFYYTDLHTYYKEYVENGQNVLNPTSFTPTKDGYDFMGWTDGTNNTILTEKVMESENIRLYAVFKQTATLTFYSGLDKADVKTVTTGKTYYAGSGTTIPMVAFAPAAASIDGWTLRGWGAAGVTDATADVAYAATSGTFNTIDVNTDSVFYALYEQDIACTFKSYGNTQEVAGKRYYNSYGNTLNASVTVPTAAEYSGWTFRGWSAADVTVADGTPTYANGEAIKGLTAGYTYYALYAKNVTLTYVANSSTDTKTGTALYNAYGNTQNATFTITNPTWELATFKGWSISASDTNVSYTAISNTALTSDTTLYAVWTLNDMVIFDSSIGITGESCFTRTPTVYNTAYVTIGDVAHARVFDSPGTKTDNKTAYTLTNTALLVHSTVVVEVYGHAYANYGSAKATFDTDAVATNVNATYNQIFTKTYSRVNNAANNSPIITAYADNDSTAAAWGAVASCAVKKITLAGGKLVVK